MEGGSANVYNATYKGENGYVIKILKQGSDLRKRKRFKNEISETINIQYEIQGVIPIVDYSIKEKDFWYIMPKAIPLIDHINSEVMHAIGASESEVELESIKIKVNSILSLAKTLLELHKRGIHHRDIKPQNIYFHNNTYCFADFGLIDFPKKESITKDSERVGPQGYMPDEMRHKTKGVDYKKVDVYELAKTFWTVLTGSKDVFLGKYDEDDKEIGISNYLKHKHHIVEIERVLTAATQKVPALRPSVNDLIETLESWLKTTESHVHRDISQWDYIIKKLFPLALPETARFENIKDIVDILKAISRLSGLNHMFMPDGGGLDLDDVEKSAEDECICMKANGFCLVVKPLALIFENICNDPSWSYVRLETKKLELQQASAEENEKTASPYETLTELSPGQYTNWKVANYKKFEDGTPMPVGARMIHRYHEESAFVFFAKSSIYNHTSATYDARHNCMKASDFRQFLLAMRNVFLIGGNMYDLTFGKILPFTKQGKMLKEAANSKKNFVEIKKTNDFIEEILKSIDFHDLCSKYSGNAVHESFFYIRLSNRTIDFSSRGSFSEKYLANNFKLSPIHFISKQAPDDALLFSDYNSAIKCISIIEGYIDNACRTSGVCILDANDKCTYFSPVLCRNKLKKPKHLFTRQEVIDALRSGDDSKDNTLVIDSSGFCQLIEGYASTCEYPVVHETFIAYNNYVGTLTDLENRHEEYLSSLSSWLKYLDSGSAQQCEYENYSMREDEIVAKINEFY